MLFHRNYEGVRDASSSLVERKGFEIICIWVLLGVAWKCMKCNLMNKSHDDYCRWNERKKNRGQLHVCKGYMSKFVYGRHNKTVV